MAKETCIHCGAEAHQMIHQNGKPFCCEGCLMVYNMLHQNNLYEYYNLHDAPGIRDNSFKETYEYLDQEEIKRSVLHFMDGNHCMIHLYIPAIHCSSCIWLLEHLERLHKGIQSSMVNFTTKRLTVSYDQSKIKLSELMGLLASIHYKAYIPKDKKEVARKEQKKLLIKLGIAGFAFGNVMLLSFPDYLASDVNLDAALINTFGWISLLISLPVLLYAASDYFQSAWKNGAKGIISIDLPIAIGILAIFIQSVYEITTRTGTGYLDSLTGLVFFLLIGKWYQGKTYEALNFENDYSSYFPLGIVKVDISEERIVPIDQLVEGDIIRVKNGEIVPADAILQSPATAVDYSFITGEAIPVTKNCGELIFAGGRIIGKSILMKVEKKAEASYLAEMWKEQAKQQESALSHTLNLISKRFTVTVLLIGLITLTAWLLIEPSKALFAFTSVLIVACPCALALSVPFAFGHGRTFFGKKGFFLKNSLVIEKLKQTNTIVFDKTGTLTDPNSFEVNFHANDESVDFSLIKSVVKQSNHPLSRAIHQHLFEFSESEVEQFEEIPGLGISAKCKGHNIAMGAANFLEIKDQQSDAAQVHVKVDDDYRGFFSIKNYYRNGWETLLKELTEHYEVHLLSGDNDREREIIGKYLKAENMHFNQSPKDKLNYIKLLKQQHQKVLMVGDGLNDAGALKESDTGISVADNIYLFSPSSDAIINARSLRNLPAFLSFTQRNMQVVYASFVLSFLYNTVGIYFAVTGQLSPIIAAVLMPLSSITVVAFTSISTLLFSRKVHLKE
jgi:P-type Cu+ transporter